MKHTRLDGPSFYNPGGIQGPFGPWRVQGRALAFLTPQPRECPRHGRLEDVEHGGLGGGAGVVGGVGVGHRFCRQVFEGVGGDFELVDGVGDFEGAAQVQYPVEEPVEAAGDAEGLCGIGDFVFDEGAVEGQDLGHQHGVGEAVMGVEAGTYGVGEGMDGAEGFLEGHSRGNHPVVVPKALGADTAGVYLVRIGHATPHMLYGSILGPNGEALPELPRLTPEAAAVSSPLLMA